MGDPLPFDYEFVFTGGFSQEVFDQCPIVDTDNTLQYIVMDIVECIGRIQQLQPGIRCIVSYGVHDDQILKVTLINSDWIP